MKKLLLTLTKDRSSFLKVLFFLFSFSFGMGMLQAQTTGLTDCLCLNNETIPGSGQFQAQIIVFSSPGESWSLVSADGFYDINSQNPDPIVDYPTGTALIEGPGIDSMESRYILQGIHHSNYTWSVIVTDGVDEVTITASHTCAYPDKTIIGDKDLCLGGEAQTYSINEPLSSFPSGLIWTLSGGGVLTGSGTEVSIDWNNALGVHTLNVTGETAEGCGIDETVTIYIRDNSPISLACNNHVNLSMNTLCEVYITPDMILEDMQLTDDAYEIVLRHIEVDTLIPNARLDGNYIGIPIEVTVVHECSGNSCWSTILLEDKNVPNLVCLEPDTLACDQVVTANINRLPIPLGVTAVEDGTGGYILYGFDGCGEAYLTYIDDVLSEALCTGPFSSVIVRQWRVEDETGNSSSCESYVYVERATLEDITFPGHWDDVLGPNPTIEACSNFTQLANGHPAPSYTGSPDGVFCLNVQVSYEDQVLPICGDKSNKIIRKWRVVDICNGLDSVFNQNITVMDTRPPVCTAPPEYVVNTTALSCGSTFEVLPPTVIFECSEWDYYVSYKARDNSGNIYSNATTDNVSGNKEIGYTIHDLPPNQDTIWIIYNFNDECGNYSQCFTEVSIIDNEQPTPVCDLHSFVALNENGNACVGPETFDDGSWDNCGVAGMSVERMDGTPCGDNCLDGYINFCCEDVGEIIMVQLTVWDYSGNSNSCMVEVEVQDNIPPVFTYCPENQIVDCSALPLSYTSFGIPTAEDACDVTITEDVVENINECGVGTVRRNFTATDGQGNEVTCSQVLTVNALNPFTKFNIRFPKNYTNLNGCSDTGTDPDDLPNTFNTTSTNSSSS